MTDLRQAAQQALEALEWVWGGEPLTGKELDAITALRQALAEPEQGPVAHSVVEPLRPDEYQCRVSVKWVGQPVSGPLYTAPTPKPEQKGWFTVSELNEWATKLPQTTHWEGCEAVHPECRKPDTDCHLQGICQRSGYSIAPTPRRPLTDEEIERACVPLGAAMLSFTEVARAIERAHGIGEQA